MRRPILILGATSAIAKATAASWAKRGHDLYLASRDRSELEKVSADMAIRYEVTVRHAVFDIEDFSQHGVFIENTFREMGEVFGVFLTSGYLGDQVKAVGDFNEARKIIEVNFTGACSVLTYCSNALAKQGKGFIAAVSSVAGDRGRQSNYVYGASKGGLSIFLEGLRNRLYPFGVHVLTIKPGFVDTAMTYGRSGMFLVASPEVVAEAIVNAVDKQKNVIYVPWFWRIIMALIRNIPECLFKRLKL